MSIERIDGLAEESREPVYAGEVVDLSVVHYRRPNGLVVRREVLAHPGAVVMVLIAIPFTWEPPAGCSYPNSNTPPAESR